jgi:hypothetical protein
MTVEQLLSECDLVRLTEENAIGTEGSVSPNVRRKEGSGKREEVSLKKKSLPRDFVV